MISAAIDNGVPLTIALSTDKAVNPVNLYGATKLCAEKIFAQANVYAPDGPARFACVRYGNVVGSRGSVIPIFKQQARDRPVSITDERMTRFWITLRRRSTSSSARRARAGRRDVRAEDPEHARDRHRRAALAPGVQRRVVGIRPGEKLHEVMVTEDEARHSFDLGDRLRDPAAARDLAPDRCPDAASGCRMASDTRRTPTTAGSRTRSCGRWPRAWRLAGARAIRSQAGWEA